MELIFSGCLFKIFSPIRVCTNIWAIHTTLYRVCCTEYTWLFVNAQFYAVLCISHTKCIFFWDLNNLIARNQHYFWKTYENVYTIFSITQFDCMKQIQLLKTYEKMCISVSNFYMKMINNNYTLIFQQYIQYNDTTACVNWPIFY